MPASDSDHNMYINYLQVTVMLFLYMTSLQLMMPKKVECQVKAGNLNSVDNHWINDMLKSDKGVWLEKYPFLAS